MEETAIDQLVEHVSSLLSERLGVRGRALEDRVRRAGRALPRDVRRAADELVSAEKMSRTPKMRLNLDQEQVNAAYMVCTDYLEVIDRRALRAEARMSMAATVIVQLATVAAMLLAVLRWRGFV